MQALLTPKGAGVLKVMTLNVSPKPAMQPYKTHPQALLSTDSNAPCENRFLD